jgi:hypothetical protein
VISRAVSTRQLAGADPHLALQLAAVPAMSAIALTFLSATLKETLWTTWLLLTLLVAATPLVFRHLATDLEDERLQWLGYVALLRVALVVTLLFVGWVPQLDPASDAFGYDPQRYYFQAQDLVNAGFNPIAMDISLNYTGVLFYYGALFKAFGHDPLLPAILNMSVTLAAVAVLIRVAYRIKGHRDAWDWTIGLCLVIPEVLWFDALTSRETVAMSLMVLAVLPLGTHFVFPERSSARRVDRGRVIVGALSFAALGMIRTTMLIPAFAALVILYVIGAGDSRQRLKGAAWITIAGVILFAAPAIAESLGGYHFGYIGWLRMSRSPQYLNEIASGWSQRSVGQLLIPSNLLEEVVFAPIRGLAYLVAPLPSIPLGMVGLRAGAWSDWQSLAVVLSAILYVVLFPVLLVSTYVAISERKRAWSLIQVPLWCTYAAIAGANIMIVERYRLMMVLLMWAGIWLGWSCDRRVLARVYAYWLVLLAVGGTLFAAYKFDF